MMTFFINQNSTLPYLRMDVINDGRFDFNKLFIALENADITFTMSNLETGIKKIANAKAYIVPKEDGCVDGYSIEYRWNQRDTKESGTYIGQFKIIFNDDIIMDGFSFPKGELIVPIAEELQINIIQSSIKK